jgi:glycosyltransferase involved in cell wall biosynthesis
MKILQIIPSLHMGGAEKFAVDLSNELALNNLNEVYLCIIDKISEDSLLLKQVNANVKLLSLDKTSGYSFKVMFKLYKLLKDIKPDMVHTHLRALTYSSFSILLLKIPTIHTIHNLAEKETKPFIQKIHFFLFNYVDVVPVSISNLVLNSVQVRYGKEFDKLIYNGVKALKKSKKFNEVEKEIKSYTNNDSIVMLNVGRISRQKNQLLLIESVNDLVSKGINNIILIIIGALDSEVEYANKCLATASINSNIHCIGLKDNIGDYMYQSDVFCLSSEYEGLPLVILEAMSMGKNVLSTPAGGVPDVVENNINGYLSEDFTIKSYTEMIQKYIKSPIQHTDLIKNIYNNKYSMNICMNNYYSLYQKIIDE